MENLKTINQWTPQVSPEACLKSVFDYDLNLALTSDASTSAKIHVKWNWTNCVTITSTGHRDEGFTSSMLFLTYNGKTRRNLERVSFTGRAKELALCSRNVLFSHNAGKRKHKRKHKEKWNILTCVLALILASILFSLWNKRSCTCTYDFACACVVNENQVLQELILFGFMASAE